MAEVKLDLAWQLKFAQSEDWEERFAISCYPLFPEVVEYMVEHETDINVMPLIFSNLFSTPNSDILPSTLAKAARKIVELCGIPDEAKVGPLYFSLTNIAMHLNTDLDTLKYLFELNSHPANWGLALNPNTPKKILNELAKVANFNIDEALIHNPNTPSETKDEIRKQRYPNGLFTCGYYYTLMGIKVVASGN